MMEFSLYDYAVADDKTMWLRDHIVEDKEEFLALLGRVIYDTIESGVDQEDMHAFALGLLRERAQIYTKSMLIDAIIHANSKEYVKYARATALEDWLKDIRWEDMAESMLPFEYFKGVLEAYDE